MDGLIWMDTGVAAMLGPSTRRWDIQMNGILQHYWMYMCTSIARDLDVLGGVRLVEYG